MKHDKSALKKQRLMIDKKLSSLKRLRFIDSPRNGWIKAIRESLGMTTAQLAKRLKVSQPSVAQLESREGTGKVTLETLKSAADALNCKLIYAIVPRNTESLESLLHQQADEAVRKHLKKISHSMGLELQSLSSNDQKSQIKRMREELIASLDSQIWDDE